MRASIVFLCLGNICRSPLAAALARGRFVHLGHIFSSLGLQVTPGWRAAEFSIAYAAKMDCDLASHRARSVKPESLAEATWLIAMTRSQGAIARNRFGQSMPGRIGILGAPGFDLQEHQHSPAMEDVDDPYGWPEEKYFACGDQIDRLLRGWTEVFTDLAESSANDSGQETQ